MPKDSTIKTIVFANDHAQQKITSQDVAKLAGVSQSAVSRVFTKGASASAKTVEKVQNAAKQLGYRIKYHAGKRINVVTHTPPHPLSVTWPKKSKDQFLHTLSGAFGSSEMTKVLNTYINNINILLLILF